MKIGKFVAAAFFFCFVAAINIYVAIILASTYFVLSRDVEAQEAKDALNYMTIITVRTEEACNRVVAELRR